MPIQVTQEMIDAFDAGWSTANTDETVAHFPGKCRRAGLEAVFSLIEQTPAPVNNDHYIRVFESVVGSLITGAARRLTYLDRATGQITVLDVIGSEDIRITVNIDVLEHQQ